MDILNCPFCGNDQVEIGEPEPEHFAVDCPECGAVGPQEKTPLMAIAAWNFAGRKDDMLKICASVFRDYERHHVGKGDAEKAKRNAELAKLAEMAMVR